MTWNVPLPVWLNDPALLNVSSVVVVVSPQSMTFFFNDTATTEIYTLSLHDALPILNVPTTVLAGVDCCSLMADNAAPELAVMDTTPPATMNTCISDAPSSAKAS